MKDYFSTQSKLYAAFRPTYPQELYQFILEHVGERKSAWDCATGNGQVANVLAGYFNEVFATDISQRQLDEAVRQSNILYSISPAEKTPFHDNQFDLITVAQALHWFDRDQFYNEAKRVARPNAILVVWGYAMLSIDPVIDKLIQDFYDDTVGPYWDNARRLVEQEYKTISFPFEEFPAPGFSIPVTWTLDQLSGYFSSWSATQQYIKEKGHDPVPPFISTLAKLWPSTTMKVTFPVFTRIARIRK